MCGTSPNVSNLLPQRNLLNPPDLKLSQALKGEWLVLKWLLGSDLWSCFCTFGPSLAFSCKASMLKTQSKATFCTNQMEYVSHRTWLVEVSCGRFLGCAGQLRVEVLT